MKYIQYILFLFLICPLISHAQTNGTNYFGVKGFLLATAKTDDAVSDILPDKDDLIKQIEIKTGLKPNPELTGKDELYNRIIITVVYNIYKTRGTDQYYGDYQLIVSRNLNIPNSNYVSTPPAYIFLQSAPFVTTNPLMDNWQKDIKQLVSLMIDAFALDYKASY